jgi:hypothetical protein
MKLENQFSSRALSMRLKELGCYNSVTHKSKPDKDGDIYDLPTVGTFYSCDIRGDIMTGIIGEQEDAPSKHYKPIKHYSLSELGQMLGYKNVPYFSAEFDMWVLPKGSALKGEGIGSVNECEIRAALLLYAIEEGIMSVEDINERLLADSIE